MSEESHTGHFFTLRKETIMKRSERMGSRKAERKGEVRQVSELFIANRYIFLICSIQ